MDQKYYFLFYTPNPIEIPSLFYEAVDVLRKLDFKIRKIRSPRGFFVYALEMIETGNDFKILYTNLPPLFWKDVKDMIRQNKKNALEQFLFGLEIPSYSAKDLEEKVPILKILDNEIISKEQVLIICKFLERKLMDLETRIDNLKEASKPEKKASEAIQSILDDDFNFKPNESSKKSQSLQDFIENLSWHG